MWSFSQNDMKLFQTTVKMISFHKITWSFHIVTWHLWQWRVLLPFATTSAEWCGQFILLSCMFLVLCFLFVQFSLSILRHEKNCQNKMWLDHFSSFFYQITVISTLSEHICVPNKRCFSWYWNENRIAATTTTEITKWFYKCLPCWLGQFETRP